MSVEFSKKAIPKPETEYFSDSKAFDKYEDFERSLGDVPFASEEKRQRYKENFERAECVESRRKIFPKDNTTSDTYNRREWLHDLIRIACMDETVTCDDPVKNMVFDRTLNIKKARESLGYWIAKEVEAGRERELCLDIQNKGGHSRNNARKVFEAFRDFVRKEKRLPYKSSEICVDIDDDSTIRTQCVSLGLFLPYETYPSGLEDEIFATPI